MTSRVPPSLDLSRSLAALASLVVVAGAAPLSAHDFWIEPSAYRAAAGSPIDIALRVGEGYRGDDVARDETRIRRFLVAGPAGEQAIPGENGVSPAGRVTLQTEGLVVLGYHNRPSAITLEADKFEAYLGEEGLERISALRAARGEKSKPGREIYSRCAKALVVFGRRSTGGHDRRLGLPLELVPEANPYLANGGRLRVRVLFHDRPLEGALVVALAREAPDRTLSARSDAEGRVVLDLAGDRTWLVKTVHMVPAPAGSGADWESLWGSLTFQTSVP
jgi:uncharacterized GH25 family protein